MLRVLSCLSPRGANCRLGVQCLIECVWEDAWLLKFFVVMATQHSATAAERGDSGSCDHWKWKMSQLLPPASLRHICLQPHWVIVTGMLRGLYVIWWFKESQQLHRPVQFSDSVPLYPQCRHRADCHRHTYLGQSISQWFPKKQRWLNQFQEK